MSDQELQAVVTCKKCGETVEPDFLGGFRPIQLDAEGVCFRCWQMEEGVFPDYRSSLQRYLDDLVGE